MLVLESDGLCQTCPVYDIVDRACAEDIAWCEMYRDVIETYEEYAPGKNGVDFTGVKLQYMTIDELDA